ncbi:hypothetical protein TNCV_4602741 [Trichonephila clavipes]|nr:hypothetical protein TNCV_4602741 [Trichonephila clavipes]
MRTNANILPYRAVPAVENFLWNDIDEKISPNTQIFCGNWSHLFRNSGSRGLRVVIALLGTCQTCSTGLWSGDLARQSIR